MNLSSIVGGNHLVLNDEYEVVILGSKELESVAEMKILASCRTLEPEGIFPQYIVTTFAPARRTQPTFISTFLPTLPYSSLQYQRLLWHSSLIA